MSKIKCILFDCMETLIDVTELPTSRDYARWAYDGSGVEGYWNNFDEFFETYIEAKERIIKRLPKNKEHNLIERFEEIALLNFKDNKDIRREISEKLMKNYWKTYTQKCYIKEDVANILPILANKYQLGVVSNFVVKDGVEELLVSHGIGDYFNSIITSVNVGWRKPNENIYNIALQHFKVSPWEVLFVGDDYINDYVQPKKLGLNVLLLDRYNNFKHITERVCDFYELTDNLNRL